MQQPVEIAVDEVEQVVARVAGIDVAKASGMVCTRMPHESVPGRRVTRVWPVKSTTTARVPQLAASLVTVARHPRRSRCGKVPLEAHGREYRLETEPVVHRLTGLGRHP